MIKLSNLHTIIISIIAIYAMTLATVYALPDAKDTIEKLANLVIGGLLAIMRPQTAPVTP
jgi:hypothetical protein